MDVDTSRKILSDLVLDSISKSTYSDSVDLLGGAIVKDFNHELFYDIVSQKELVLKKLLDNSTKGEPSPIFDGVFAMAKFLRIVNRSERAVKNVKNIRVSSPRGLSVESLLSRGYSITRGVVSPKYVATETALRAFRKKNANILAKLSTDPKMVNSVIEMFELGEVGIRKYNANLYSVLISGLAEVQAVENRSKTRQQVRKLELDEFNLGE